MKTIDIGTLTNQVSNIPEELPELIQMLGQGIQVTFFQASKNKEFMDNLKLVQSQANKETGNKVIQIETKMTMVVL